MIAIAFSMIDPEPWVQHCVSSARRRFGAVGFGGSLVERKDDLPVVLHVDDDPAALRRLVERARERADVRVAVVGLLARRRRCGGRSCRAAARARRRPLEHLEVAVGVAERRDRPAADLLLDADRLAGLVVDEVDLRQPHDARARRRAARTRASRGCRPPARAGCRRRRSAHGRMKSTPPPDTMNVLKPFARR